METCYKVFRRELLERISLEQNRFGFEPEFTAKLSKAGEQIMEVPIRYDLAKLRLRKKIGLRDGIDARGVLCGMGGRRVGRTSPCSSGTAMRVVARCRNSSYFSPASINPHLFNGEWNT